MAVKRTDYKFISQMIILINRNNYNSTRRRSPCNIVAIKLNEKKYLLSLRTDNSIRTLKKMICYKSIRTTKIIVMKLMKCEKNKNNKIEKGRK